MGLAHYRLTLFKHIPTKFDQTSSLSFPNTHMFGSNNWQHLKSIGDLCLIYNIMFQILRKTNKTLWVSPSNHIHTFSDFDLGFDRLKTPWNENTPYDSVNILGNLRPRSCWKWFHNLYWTGLVLAKLMASNGYFQLDKKVGKLLWDSFNDNITVTSVTYHFVFTSAVACPPRTKHLCGKVLEKCRLSVLLLSFFERSPHYIAPNAHVYF